MRDFSHKYFYNKGIVLVFTILFSLLMILGLTYAWITVSDTRVNEFRGDGRFETMLTENFQPDIAWQPGAETIKEVRVYNAGTIPAFIRISLEEVLTVYEVETGKGETGNVTASMVGQHKAWLYDSMIGQLYGLDNGDLSMDRADDLLHFINLKFGAVIVPGQTPPLAPYWLYADGYFYYSKALAPDQYTEALLTSVSVKATAPNLVKNGTYRINVDHESIQAGNGTLSVWGITDGPVFDMLDGI